MMYGGPTNSWGGQRIIAILAVVGLAWFVMSSLRSDPSRVSGWGGQSLFGPAKAAQQAPLPPAAGGFTGQTVAQAGRGLENDDPVPHGNPLRDVHAVMTQGYGVGSHAPANIWGAVDLAIDGDGDGQADPQGTDGAPVYATHDGTIQLARDTYPAGNHIWVIGTHFKTGYSHLKDFAVQDGQAVKRGDVIGYVGSTGESSGPHLDYQVWEDGVNVNPLDFGALAQMR